MNSEKQSVKVRKSLIDKFQHILTTEGGFAKVKLAIHRLTNQPVACKIIDKISVKVRRLLKGTQFISDFQDDLPRMRQEMDALKSLSHPNICQLYQCHESDRHIYLILEFCKGGELFEYIVAKEKVEESEARSFFRQILSAVGYIHCQGFAHRDLKPENLLLSNERHLKVTDFGLCAKPKGGLGTFLKTRCGSPSYIAPEILAGKPYFGGQCDIWSMGVLLFTLVSGYLPFDEENAAILLVRIQSNFVPYPEWLSGGCRFVISRMLEINPAKRITIEELSKDPWVCCDMQSSIKPKRKFGIFSGYNNSPVKIGDTIDTAGSSQPPIDDDVVDLMSRLLYVSYSVAYELIEKRLFDFWYGTYLILTNFKSRGTLSVMFSPINSLLPAAQTAKVTPANTKIKGEANVGNYIIHTRAGSSNGVKKVTGKRFMNTVSPKDLRHLFGRISGSPRSKKQATSNDDSRYILLPSQDILIERQARVRNADRSMLPAIPKDRQMLQCTCNNHRCLYMPTGREPTDFDCDIHSTPQAYKRGYNLISNGTEMDAKRKRMFQRDDLSCKPSKRILLSSPAMDESKHFDWILSTPQKTRGADQTFECVPSGFSNSISSDLA